MANFVTIEGRELAKALKPLAWTVEKRNTYPILSTVILAVDGSVLTLRATDLDIEITTTLDVIDAAGKWSICLPAHTLEAITSVAGPMTVKIEAVEHKGTELVTGWTGAEITLGDGDASYTFGELLSADQFPAINGERGGLIENFTNGRLGLMLKSVKNAISNEETRYYLNGVCWARDVHGLAFVATDGHRLYLNRYSKEAPPAAQRSAEIIPRKTVGLLTQFFAGADIAVHSVNKGNSVSTSMEFVIGRTTIRSKLIEGTFPDFYRVIPKRETLVHEFAFNRQELLDAMKRLAAIYQVRGSTAIRLYDVGGRVAMSRRTPDIGEAKATLRTAWPTGAAPAQTAGTHAIEQGTGFNARYLREIVTESTGKVTMLMSDQGAPHMFLDENEQVTRVLMPMRV